MKQNARFNMVLFEQSHMRTKTGGMNRRKERVPHTRTRPRAHARLDARRRPRPFYVGIFDKTYSFNLSNFVNFFDISKKRNYPKKKNTNKN